MPTYATERVSTLSDVPTCQEEGVDAIWQEVWLGVFAPAGTPDDVVTTLREAFADILKDEGLHKMVGRIASEINDLDADEWREVLDEERTRLVDLYGLE